MPDQRAVNGAERSLKRRQELEDLAARGDEWAKKRLQINEYQQRHLQDIRASAASGDDASRQHLLDRRAKRRVSEATYRRKQQAKLTASHNQAIVEQNGTVEPSPNLEDDMQLRRSSRRPAGIAQHKGDGCGDAIPRAARKTQEFDGYGNQDVVRCRCL